MQAFTADAAHRPAICSLEILLIAAAFFLVDSNGKMQKRILKNCNRQENKLLLVKEIVSQLAFSSVKPTGDYNLREKTILKVWVLLVDNVD